MPVGDREALQQAIVEFIGTFALIFLGAGAIIVTGNGNLVAIALAHGLAIGVMVAAAGHISGGSYNPAVTVGLWISGKLSPPRVAIYIIAELLGAIAAALALVIIFPSELVDAVGLGTPAVGDGFSVGGALLAEAIGTFFLMFVIYGTAVDLRGPSMIAGLAIGLTITIDIFAFGGVSGAAVNPARHLGPALVDNSWGDFWIWWVGPVIGAAAAAALYHFVLAEGTGPATAEDEPEMYEATEPDAQRRRT